MFLRLTALLFLWQAVAFESHNFTGCHVDIVRIKEQDSVTLSAHSLVSCAIVGQKLYQWLVLVHLLTNDFEQLFNKKKKKTL